MVVEGLGSTGSGGLFALFSCGGAADWSVDIAGGKHLVSIVERHLVYMKGGMQEGAGFVRGVAGGSTRQSDVVLVRS